MSFSSDSDKPATNPEAPVSAAPGFRDSRDAGSLVATPAEQELLGSRSGRFARPPILYAAPKPLDLLRALQRRWLLALTVGVVLAVPTAVITWMMVPETYQTYSMLKVRLGAGVLYDVKDEGYGFSAQKSLIKSPLVLNAALAEPGISELPAIKSRAILGTEVDWLGSQIEVQSSGGNQMGDLLEIGMSGDNPAQLTMLVNAVTKAYLDRVAGEEVRQLLKRRELLNQKYLQKSQEVQTKRDQLYQLARAVGTASSETAQAKQQLLADYVLQLRKDVTQNRSAVLQKEQALKLFKQQNGLTGNAAEPPPEALVEEIVNQDPDYLGKLAQVKKLEDQLHDLLAVSRDPNSSLVQASREKVARMKSLAEDQKKGVRKQLMQDIKDKKLIPRVQAELEQRTSELAGLKAVLSEEENQFKTLSQEMSDLQTSTAELDRRKEDLANVVVITNQLGLALEKIELELGSGDRVALLDKAHEPRSAQDARRNRFSSLFGLGALAMGLGGVSLLEFHARRITSPIEVDEGLGVRVIGDVPMLSQHPRHWWGSIDAAAAGAIQGIMDESIDGVRAMLLHSAGGDAARVVMVTSAKAGEGKTTIAVSLAASLGRCGRRTLLIDGDLRRPNVHRLLELPLDKGFAEVLRREANVQEVIRPSRATGMWVMTAGQCDSASLQALTRNTVAQIFESLRSEFDSIIIDSGPVLAVVDPLLLGQHCDGAIVSIVHRVSQITPVYETFERLKSTGIPVLGCVVNGTSHTGLGQGHGYYGYGYGYGYGYVHGNGQSGSVPPTPGPAS